MSPPGTVFLIPECMCRPRHKARTTARVKATRTGLYPKILQSEGRLRPDTLIRPPADEAEGRWWHGGSAQAGAVDLILQALIGPPVGYDQRRPTGVAVRAGRLLPWRRSQIRRGDDQNPYPFAV